MIVAALLLFQVGFATGLAPDTVTVGDPFRVVVRVFAPPGARVEFPPFLLRSDSIGALRAAPEVSTDPGGVHLATYHLVAWVTGAYPAPPVTVTVHSAAGVPQRYRVQPPLPVVRSVLPTDTTGLRPRGPKDVWGSSRAQLLPWLLLGLAALLLLALLAWWLWKRRRPSGTWLAQVDPRERALNAMAELRPEHTEAFYVQLSAILREFVAAQRREWGLDLATPELLERMAVGGVPAPDSATLRSLLGAADRVKFARSRPEAEEAQRALRAAQHWVHNFGQSEAKAA